MLVVFAIALARHARRRRSPTSSRARRRRAATRSRATPPTRRPRPASTPTPRSSSTTTSTSSTTSPPASRPGSPAAITASRRHGLDRRHHLDVPDGQDNWKVLGNGYAYNLEITAPSGSATPMQQAIQIVSTGCRWDAARTQCGSAANYATRTIQTLLAPVVGRELPDDRERDDHLRSDGDDEREDLLDRNGDPQRHGERRTSTPRCSVLGQRRR